MRNTALAGLLLCVFTLIALSPSAHAESVSIFNDNSVSVDENIQLATGVISSANKPQKQEEPVVPKTVTHKVIKGETLTTIAAKYKQPWQRLFYKNVNINNPDDIKPDDILVIPKAKEKLASRIIPAIENLPETAPATVAKPVANKPQLSSYSTSGNTYTYGYCTYYVKNRRSDLPNNLGNADTWVSRAAAQGLATGSVPRVGAVGQLGMHVVYVEKVHPDNTITISEMNREGWNVLSTRRVPANTFHYIY